MKVDIDAEDIQRALLELWTRRCYNMQPWDTHCACGNCMDGTVLSIEGQRLAKLLALGGGQ